MINIKMNLENNFTAFQGSQGSLVVNDDTFFSSIQAVIDGDFNGDGKIDLFVSQIIANGRQNSPVIVLLGDGSGGFSDGTSLLFKNDIPELVFASRLFSADFNNDGKPDIFVPDFGKDELPFPGGQNRLFLTSPTGMIDATSSLPQVLDQSHSASVGDFDSDGDIDIIVNNLNSQDGRAVNILDNNGKGQFIEKQELAPSPFSVQFSGGHTWSFLHDINLDGSLDLILGTWDNTNRPSEIYLNNGQGNFALSNGIALPSSGIPIEVVVDIDPIDLNGDTLPDLILSVTNGGDPGSFYTYSYLQFLINEGDGRFRDETNERLPQENSETGNWYKFVETVDLNSDGFLDLVVSGVGGGHSGRSIGQDKVFQNNGSGIFSELTSGSLEDGSSSEVFAPVDIFFDGKEEIIFSYFDGFKLIPNETPAIPETVENGVYRFFNTQTGTHFYSASEIERDSIINNLDNFNFESAAFKAATEANGPTASVFRFFNTETGTHFFTQSTVERDSIIENLPSFNLEGEAYLGYTEQVAGSTPLYRFFNTQTGTHFYTAAEAEKDSIVANLPSFNFEGTAYWVDPVMG